MGQCGMLKLADDAELGPAQRKRGKISKVPHEFLLDEVDLTQKPFCRDVLISLLVVVFYTVIEFTSVDSIV